VKYGNENVEKIPQLCKIVAGVRKERAKRKRPVMEVALPVLTKMDI
jgi:hypothetical protein